MRSSVLIGALAAALLILVSTIAPAHHSTAQFDRETDQSYTGLFTGMSWTNPHIYIYLDVEQDGEVWTLRAEGGGLRALIQNGWSRDMFERGDQITVTGSPMRNGRCVRRTTSCSR